MEKLIELLNNFIDRNYKNYWHRTGTSIHTWRTIVISKEFKFIKDLVERDLIDFESMNWNGKIISYLTDVADYKRNDIKENLVLMLLSIQDDPIKYLISILK